MPLLVTGLLDRITEREAGNNGNTWTEKTLVVADWGQTIFATVAKDFGPLPAVGEAVALTVALRTFVRKDGSAGVGYTALGRDSRVESSLPAPAATA